MGSIEILGGVGLTIFGVRFLRKGLDRLFGGKLIGWLSRMTGNPLHAFAGGVVAGTVAPSSAGLSLTAAQMLGSGKLNAEGMLAMLLGANVGLTVTVQLLAFHLQDYAGLMILAGVIGFQFLTRELFRGIGQCVLALGFVFLAIGLIGQGAREVASSQEIRQLLHLLDGHPWLVLAAVACLTVVLQSSTATIGLGLGLASSGLLTAGILIPWVLGTNLGLGLTSLIAGWPQIEGRRMGLGNLAVKFLIALPFMVFPEMTDRVFGMWPDSLTRQTAMFHTEFNILVGLIALPLLGVIHRVTSFLIMQPENEDIAARESFLDPNVLETPSLALARATRETLRMADHVRVMLESFWKAFLSGNLELARRLQREDDVVDRMNLDLKDYLSRIGEGKSAEDTDWQFTLLTFSNELESVGDLIDKQLCDLLVKMRGDGIVLPREDNDSLLEAYVRVIGRLEQASGLLTSRNREAARTFLAGKESFNDWCRQLQREHYERLKAAPTALGSSAFFLDFLNGLRRINSHISTLGYAFAGRSRRSKL